jgi:hypothetical protein
MGANDFALNLPDSSALAAAVSDALDPLIGQIDREGLYPGAALRALGEQGAYRHHLASQRADG